VIDKLKTGDFETLGVNGQAFRDEEKKVSGIWVVAVQDGSPAAQVGMKPGDIITTMKGFPVGLDGKMRDYCKVLRSSTTTEPIGVEVYRPDTQKTLSGEFRGRELTESFSFAEPETASAVADPGQGTDGDPYTYVRVQDDSGRVSVEVPTAYSEVDGAEFSFDGGTSPAVIATTSLSEFKDADIPTAPGVFVTSVDLAQFGVPAGTKIPAGSYEQVLDTLSKTVSTSCTIGDRNDFDRNGVLGRFQTFTDCGPAKTATFVVVAAPPDSSYLLLILFVAKDKEDLFALDRAGSTFRVQ
jgi:serine protease Do